MIKLFPTIPPPLARALVQMTAEGCGVSLVHALVRGVYTALQLDESKSRLTVRFFETKPARKPGKLIASDPLDPGKHAYPLEELPWLEAVIASGKLELVLRADGRWVAVYPVLREQAAEFLVIDGMEVGPRDNELIEFLLEIFRNQYALINSKERDPLTGLFNRTSFDDKIGRVLYAFHGRSQRVVDISQRGAALAVIDVDYFKRVNDRFGHLMGDEVLIMLARIMEHCFRHTDYLFRFGGEEFVAILNNVTPAETNRVLERLRDAVECYDFPQVGTVTVSVGYVTIASGDVPSALLDRADQALYYSKNHGRNLVSCHQELLDNGKIVGAEFSANDIEVWS